METTELIKRAVRRLLGRSGESAPAAEPPEVATLSDRDREIVDKAMPYSMTGQERIVSLIDAVRYCVKRDVPGAFVECGVWRGGSVMAMIYTLQELGRADRDIYLFDTFEGMTTPTEVDTSPVDRTALEWFKDVEGTEHRAFPHLFDTFDEDLVRKNVLGTGYPAELLHFVKGRVEDTIPGGAPDAISLLRLDTDWYESTRHELVHLYPRLAQGGVLIIDDYGHWDGCRLAVDEYFSTQAEPLLLTRIDYAGRLAIKH